jgi:anti-sigma B factor antagonist
MPLTLQSENVGHYVAVIRCHGRIVSGEEVSALQLEVEKVKRLRNKIVLQWAEVNYVDSAGLGALVRLFGVLRVGGGGLKLCQLSPFVHKVLKATNLLSAIPTYATEQQAVEAFSAGPAPVAAASGGPRTKIVCLDTSRDLLAYLKALLTAAGYEVLTARQTSDAKTLVTATDPHVVIYGPGSQVSELVIEKFRASNPKVQVLQLPPDFSTGDASEAGAELLSRVQSALAKRA